MVDDEVVQQRRAVSSLMDLVKTHRIVDHFDQAAVGPCCQDLVRLQPQRQLLDLKYLVNLRDELHCELLLTDIIDRLHDDTAEVPGLELAEGRVLLHSDALGLGRLLVEGSLVDDTRLFDRGTSILSHQPVLIALQIKLVVALDVPCLEQLVRVDLLALLSQAAGLLTLW